MRWSATFWDRAEQLAIGLLDPAAAAAALTQPFARLSEPVVSEALALEGVVENCQRYPYFLQLFGAALWDATARRGAQTIDAAVAAEALAVFDRRRQSYYQSRRDELHRAGLLDVAAELASAFDGHAALRQAEVDALLGPSTEESIRIRDGLSALGYVWNPPGDLDMWRPGIPSLMAFVRRSLAADSNA